VTIRRRDERGASLVLAIVFMVVIGAIGGAVLSSLTSGLSSRVALDDARDREYAADGAIQTVISQIYGLANGPTHVVPGQPCPAPANIPDFPLNNVVIHTDCVGALATTRQLYRQLNVIFVTCAKGDVSGGVCPDVKVIIRAQVNFQATSTGVDLHVQRTWIQAWSVNG
jgi:hypothetical protein